MPNARLLLSASVAAMLLSACATVPDLGTTPQARAGHVPEQKAFASPTAAWPNSDWWTAYGDAQLDTLIGEGLQGSPTMAIAQARLRRAQAVADQAGAASLPSLTFNASAALSKPSYNTGLPTPPALRGYNDTGRATLDVGYRLDFWGETRATIAAATSEAQANAADLAATRLVLSTAIATTYAELARLGTDHDVLTDSLQVRVQTLGLVQRRFDGGYDSQGELEQAKAGPPAARAELDATDEQIALTRLRLATLTGAAPDRAAAINRPMPPALQGFGLPANLPAELIGRRADLAAARLRVEAASSRIHVAHSQFYPNVNLVALLGVQALGLGALTEAGSDLGAIGPAISLPIFDGGRRAAGYKIARADYDAAIGAYDAVLLSALEDVAGAVASERALDLRLSDAREALAANTRGWALARRRYDAGAADFQSVLIAEDRMLANRRLVASLESRRFVLNVALVRALGGGWQDGHPRP